MYPERIVCLAAEMPAILDQLGVLDRVVGISAYTTEPPQALSLPKVSGFRSGSIRRILEQKPDLAILTSGVQHELGSRLAAQGVSLLHVNPHRLADVYHTVSLLGNVTGKPERAVAINAELRQTFDAIETMGRGLPWHPRVYFEEWMDPMICGTGWVSDIITMAGGIDIFRHVSIHGRTAASRQVTQDQVAAAKPDVFLASWCGKPFEEDTVRERPQAYTIPALHYDAVYELDGGILQCGPSLVEAARQVHRILREFTTHHLEPKDQEGQNGS